jgi:tetratricopeptide (TPR) repeat protein
MLIRLRPPDLGVDILYRDQKKAFQCKSSERGIYGRIDAEESAKSLETAIKHKSALGWRQYSFATNADYTGAGYEKILLRARKKGVLEKQLEFLGPAYWDQLCVEHSKVIEDRFDYRLSLSQKDLYEAVAKALPQVSLNISSQGTDRKIVLTNNLTELKLEHNLVGDLSVETYLKLVIELLGLADLLHGTPAHYETLRPLFSLRAGGKELSLFVRLKDLNLQSGDTLEFHAKLGEEALAVFNQVINQSPTNLVAQRARAGLLRSMGLDEALAGYQAILAEQPDDAEARTEYAETLKMQGDFISALAAYEEILGENRDHAGARSGYAQILKEMGSLEHALSAVESSPGTSSNADTASGGPEIESDDQKDQDALNKGREQPWETERLLQELIWGRAQRRRNATHDAERLAA